MAASFKTWQLADTLLWNYAPSSLRSFTFNEEKNMWERSMNARVQARPQTIQRTRAEAHGCWPITSNMEAAMMPPQGMTFRNPSYMDINVFIEKLPLKEIACSCYTCDGEIYYVSGERHDTMRYYGLMNGAWRFHPNQPVRFMTNSDMNLSVLTTNIFLLYQLYVGGWVEPGNKCGKWRFRWKKSAYTRGSSAERTLAAMPKSLRQQYPVLDSIEKPEGATDLPTLPYTVRNTQERVLTKADELRGSEGTYLPEMDSRLIWESPALLADACSNRQDEKFSEYVNRRGIKSGKIRRQELWTVNSDTFFSYMKCDPERKKSDSVVRYEFFSFHTDVERYYEEWQEHHERNEKNQKGKRVVELIYCRHTEK